MGAGRILCAGLLLALFLAGCDLPSLRRSPPVQENSPVPAVAHAAQALHVESAPAESASVSAEPIDTDVSSHQVVSQDLVSTWRVSQDSDGTPGDGSAVDVGMSADGRYIAYTTSAANLTPGDDNGYDDVYVYDAQSGETRLVSANADGDAGDGWSGGPAVAADGRFIAFYSWAGDLTPDDVNAVKDVFVWDRVGDSLERISRSPDGSPANDRSGDSRSAARPAISADGAIIAYHSHASNLVDLDTNGRQDVFVYDAGLRKTTRVSVSSDGAQADGDSRDPALSADGRFVVFSSRAEGLDSSIANPNRLSQVYLHDRATGTTRLISAAPNGVAGDGDSVTPVLSGNGQTVAFASHARNLVENDDNGFADIFVYDVARDVVERISVSSAATPGNGDSVAPAISLEGRYVGFASDASNLVNGDGNGAADIFVFDRLARHTVRASVGVVRQWTGIEADGDSVGPPAIAAGGRLVAYVSHAANLVGGSPARTAQVYALERSDIPSYTVRGRILDDKNRPIPDVTVAAGPHQATTGDDGRYVLQHVTGGTYTLSPSREATSFVPARRTVSVVADADGVDFRGVTNGGSNLAFLSLPFAGDYSTSDFLQILRDSDEGGWVDAWFDHDMPDKSKNESVVLWDGRMRSSGFFNAILGCYERRCYDGHDGTDFPYRDPVPATKAFEPFLVQPAAPGIVVHVVDNCGDGGRWCNGGYGNEVILLHDNGYFSRYAHLATVGERGDLRPGDQLDESDVLGVMGSTGNSFGAHLHFAVHQDDGNGSWDGEKLDVAVDPFGWSGRQPDPWAEAGQGAISRWLWNENPTVERLLFGSHGAAIADLTGSFTVTVPPGALPGQVRLELDPSAPAAAPEAGLRSLGLTFWLRLLDWYAPTLDTTPARDLSDAVLALPLRISVRLTSVDTRHLNLDQAQVVRWDDSAERWQPLPTMISQDGANASAVSDRLGNFDLQAPLLCAGDTLEPDDAYHAATFLEPGDAPLQRLFDLQEDEDWVRFDAKRGQGLHVRVDEIADGVALAAEIYGVDGLTVLASAESVGGRPVHLAWSPPDDGTYFVRVAPAAGSRTDCSATYAISVD